MRRLADIAAAMARYDTRSLFGELKGSQQDKLVALRSSYRQLAALVHPDQFAGTSELQLAHQTFIQLTRLRDELEIEIKAEGAPALPGPPGAQPIARPRPPRPPASPFSQPFDDDEPKFPPLPVCVCVALSKTNLPYKTVFAYAKTGYDYAVVSGSATHMVEHSNLCRWYRDMNEGAILKEPVHLSGSLMLFSDGWRWDKSLLRV